MQKHRSYARRMARSLVRAGVALLLVVGAAERAAAQGMTVEGTWLVQVTTRNCDTGAALATFPSLVAFGRDGRISESPGSVAFAPGQRSAGHGEWERLGNSTFSQRVLGLILFSTPPNPPASPGFETGWQLIEHTITLDDPDNFHSTGTTQFYRSNGEVYRTGCSTAVARRFE